ncbi:MAG: ATP-binding cassette domain-containing protein, partial [Selenomonadaceae bacterium]|nr:ATP-binding cassette domain-containing protein [Selenomonadaceae bacterium]
MNLLEVRNLSTSFHIGVGTVQAVRDISFHIGQGESVGIVGESGSGKSV